MTSKHQYSPSVDDYLKDGWIPIAETRLGITYEKAAPTATFGTVIAATVLALWALFAAIFTLGLALGIGLVGFILLAIHENTRPPLRMLILHETQDTGATDAG